MILIITTNNNKMILIITINNNKFNILKMKFKDHNKIMMMPEIFYSILRMNQKKLE